MFKKKCLQRSRTKFKQVPSKTNPFKLYPSQKPVFVSECGWDSLFDRLEMCIRIGMDPNEDNSYLTRSEQGMFIWGKQTMTMTKLQDSNVSESIETNQIKRRILYMLELMSYILVLESNVIIVDGNPFRQFIGPTK